MKQHDVLNNLFKVISSVLLISVGLIFTLNVQAKQSILLDTNGQPLSDEILLQLSSNPNSFNNSSSGSLNKKKSDTQIKDTVLKKTVLKRNKPRSNPLLEEELLAALKAGKTQRAKQLLKIGTSPTYKNYKGETPLGIAVTRGWASMVIGLIENGANVKEKGAKGVTLLHAASAHGLTDVVKLLVRHGLNPSQKTDKNWTPLHVAARYGHWQLVQYYLSIGVDPNIRNSDGKTALGLARHLRHQGIIKILSRVTTKRSLDFSTNKKRRAKNKKR